MLLLLLLFQFIIIWQATVNSELRFTVKHGILVTFVFFDASAKIC
jgi:hypothetical protein